MSNPFLFLGTLGALGVHVAATYSPFFQRVLGLRPLGLDEVLRLGLLALPLLLLMELHKAWTRRRRSPSGNAPAPSVGSA
jgi:hypothetical protein